MKKIARRRFMQWLAGAGGLLTLQQARAHHTDTHFADESAHKVVYECNKADAEYLAHILFSVGELIRKYGDDVEVVVTCFGAGVHLLGKEPGRPIRQEEQQRAASLAAYGVAFHACRNTMKSLQWTDDDIVDYAKIVEVGAEDLMLLQEKGFAYIAW